MNCPRCEGELRTIETRSVKGFEGATRRRRACPLCGDRLTTYEISQQQMAHVMLGYELLVKTKELQAVQERVARLRIPRNPIRLPKL